jgi:hypothetical protein
VLGLGTIALAVLLATVFGAPACARNSVLGQMAGRFSSMVVGPVFGAFQIRGKNQSEAHLDLWGRVSGAADLAREDIPD